LSLIGLLADSLLHPLQSILVFLLIHHLLVAQLFLIWVWKELLLLWWSRSFNSANYLIVKIQRDFDMKFKWLWCLTIVWQNKKELWKLIHNSLILKAVWTVLEYVAVINWLSITYSWPLLLVQHWVQRNLYFFIGFSIYWNG